MDWFQVIVLALLQGLTEFLPISSSAHLILLPQLLGWPDQGLAMDVAVHVGTLVAVVWYFRLDVVNMTTAWFARVAGGERTADSELAWAVIIGALPILLMGVPVYLWWAELFRSPVLIACTTLLFGLLLWWADKAGSRTSDEYTITFRQAFVIGCAQILALIPGVSRSGITMTAGLALGLTRKAAARFSFLVSIPVILCAGAVNLLGLLGSPDPVDWSALLIGLVLSAITAYLCIAFFLKLVETIGLLPFVIYRILLAGLLFYVFLF